MEGNGRQKRRFLTPCDDGDISCIENILSSIMTEMMNIAVDSIVSRNPVKISLEFGEGQETIRYEVYFDEKGRISVPEHSLEWVKNVVDGVLGRKTISPRPRVDRRKTLGII